MATEKLFQDVFQTNFTDFFNDSPDGTSKGGASGGGSGQDRDKKNDQIVIDKSPLLQKARNTFHDATFIRSYPDECIQTLTEILQSFHPSSYVTSSSLLAANEGGTKKKKKSRPKNQQVTFFTAQEATELFFDTTQLFVSQNLRVRRMTYVVLKELIPLCSASDVIIVISCLTKDMTRHMETSNAELNERHQTVFRANALRVLVHVLDHNEADGGDGSAKATMLSTMERYIQQALLDYMHHPSVSSSALLCALHWLDPPASLESSSSSSSYLECALLVKRWMHHVKTVLDKSNDEMVCYHALLLYYQMKKLDKVGVVKLVQTYTVLNNEDSYPNENTVPSNNIIQRDHNTGRSNKRSQKLQSIMATICIIRYITKLIHDELIVYSNRSNKRRKMGFQDGDNNDEEIISSIGQTWGYTYLLSCIRQRQKIQEVDHTGLIAYEACRGICILLPYLSPSSSYVDEMYRTVMRHLRMMLSSLKPSKRYASVKILCMLSSKTTFASSSPQDAPHPHAKYTKMYISKVHLELRSLCNDPNRMVGTYSIMTLLQTMQLKDNDTELALTSVNNGSSLLRVICSFLLDQPLAEEYRIMIINSLKVFCINAPSSSTVFAIVGFLATCLREGGTVGKCDDNFGFKRAVLNSMISIMDHRSEAKEASLYHLCEYIEDCDFVSLSTQILHILGTLGPQTKRPSKYCRFILNRIMLEKSCMIRSAAVFSLAKFGASCPNLTSQILSLLKGRYCLMDSDDETRDRVLISVNMLEKIQEDCRSSDSDTLENKEGDDNIKAQSPPTDDEYGFQEQQNDESSQNDDMDTSLHVLESLPMSFHTLERRLLAYRESAYMECADTLTFDSLSVIPDEYDDVNNGEDHNDDANDGTDEDQLYGSMNEPTNATSIINSIPDFASYGKVFNSTPMVSLTEMEAEYVVQCVKHVFEEHVVLQFVVENTIEDQELGNVHVTLDYESEKFHTIGEIAAQTIKYGTSSNCFTVLKRDTTKGFSADTIACELKFSVERVDPSTGQIIDGSEGWEEEYVLENIEINSSDFMNKAHVDNFRLSWREIGNNNEILQKFSMQQNLNIDDAIVEVIRCMGMVACDGTDRMDTRSQQNRKLQSHMIHLSGRFLLGTSVVPVLARSQISITADATILKLAVRSENVEVSKLMAECIS